MENDEQGLQDDSAGSGDEATTDASESSGEVVLPASEQSESE